jgi:hypothetical protein
VNGQTPSSLREFTADQQQYRRLRHYAFFGVAAFIACLIAMFAWWLRAYAEHVFAASFEPARTQAALFLAPLIVIASLVAISLLPTVRFVFRGGAQKEETDDVAKSGLAIWPTLFSELVDILKSYVNGRKAAS